VVTAVVPMTLGASRRGRGVLLAAIALVQCYATRTQDGCAALSYHGGVPGAGRGLPQVRQQGVGPRRDPGGGQLPAVLRPADDPHCLYRLEGRRASPTHALAVDLATHGIHVNAIAPGPTLTGLTRASYTEFTPKHGARQTR